MRVWDVELVLFNFGSRFINFAPADYYDAEEQPNQWIPEFLAPEQVFCLFVFILCRLAYGRCQLWLHLSNFNDLFTPSIHQKRKPI